MNFIFYFLLRDMEYLIKKLIPFFDFNLNYLKDYKIIDKEPFVFIYENIEIFDVNEEDIDVKSLILQKDFTYDNTNYLNVLTKEFINSKFKVGLKDNKEILIYEDIEDFMDLILSLDFCFSLKNTQSI